MKWDALLYYERMDGKEEGRIEGELAGQIKSKIEDIFSFLEDIGNIPDEIKTKIEHETNLETLSKWIKLAGRAVSMDEFIEKM